jgi:hypothetical protein
LVEDAADRVVQRVGGRHPGSVRSARDVSAA